MFTYTQTTVGNALCTMHSSLEFSAGKKKDDDKTTKIEFEVMDPANCFKSSSQLPSGFTKNFLNLLQETHEVKRQQLTVKDFWLVHEKACDKIKATGDKIKATDVIHWESLNIVVKFNGLDFKKHVWKNDQFRYQKKGKRNAVQKRFRQSKVDQGFLNNIPTEQLSAYNEVRIKHPASDVLNLELRDIKIKFGLASHSGRNWEAKRLKKLIIELAFEHFKTETLKSLRNEMVKESLESKLIDATHLIKEEWNNLQIHGEHIYNFQKPERCNDLEILNLSAFELQKLFRLSTSQARKLVKAFKVPKNHGFHILFLLKLQNQSLLTEAQLAKLKKHKHSEKITLNGKSSLWLAKELKNNCKDEEELFFCYDDEQILAKGQDLRENTKTFPMNELLSRLKQFEDKNEHIEEDILNCDFAAAALLKFSQKANCIQIAHCKTCEEAVQRELPLNVLKPKKNELDSKKVPVKPAYICPQCKR